MNTYFHSKIALITGAASGIGLALSKALTEEGCTVYMTDINENILKEEAKKIGDRAVPFHLDISDSGQFEKCVSELIKKEGKIDFLFNNAALGYSGEALGYTLETWNKIIDVNIKGTVNGISIVYPIMKEQGYGQIVNTASLAGLIPLALMVPYATTKHAIVGLTRSLRIEARKYGVRVNVLCPGSVDTKMLDSASPTDMPKESQINSRAYLKEISGKLISADKLAVKALKGVQKNKEIIFYPPKAKEMWMFSKMFPKKLSKLAYKAMLKAQNRK